MTGEAATPKAAAVLPVAAAAVATIPGGHSVELQQRARELGVALHFEYEFEPEYLEQAPFTSSGLIVAADGINSKIRRAFTTDFGTTVEVHRNKFCWLGSTRLFNEFVYFFRETEHGIMVAHCYQYAPNQSTWIIEMSPETWTRHGFGEMEEADL